MPTIAPTPASSIPTLALDPMERRHRRDPEQSTTIRIPIDNLEKPYILLL
jgi:hypothetical protein